MCKEDLERGGVQKRQGRRHRLLSPLESVITFLFKNTHGRLVSTLLRAREQMG